MRFSLRTLVIVMLLGGPVLAGMWWWLPKIPLNVRVFGHLIGIHVWFAMAVVIAVICVKFVRWWFEPVRD